MKKDVMEVAVLAMAGRAFSFLIPFVIAAVFGSTIQTDAFFLAFGIILLVQMVLGHVFEIAVVPHIASVQADAGDVHAFLGGILARTTVILAGVALALLYVVNPIIQRFADLDPVSRSLHFKILLEMVPMIFFMAWTSTLNGAFYAEKRFRVAALSPAIRSVTALAAVLALHATLGIHSIALGFSLGEGLRFAVTLLFYSRNVGRLRLQWTVTSGARVFFASALYQTIGFSAISSLGLINQTMSGLVGVGALSIYSYGERLRNVPSLLFFSGVLPVVFSHWAHDYSRAADQMDWVTVRSTIWKLTLGASVLALVAVVYRHPITWAAFRWGEFPEAQLQSVSGVFAIMMAAIPFDVLGLLCSRLLIIYRRDLVYSALALLRVPATILFIYVLMEFYDLMAVPIGFAIVSALYSLWLYRIVRRILNEPGTYGYDHRGISKDERILHI